MIGYELGGSEWGAGPAADNAAKLLVMPAFAGDRFVANLVAYL